MRAVAPDASRPEQSPRITIRWVLGAPRLTTSGCRRRRAQARELAHVLATDPRRPRRFAPEQGTGPDCASRSLRVQAPCVSCDARGSAPRLCVKNKIMKKYHVMLEGKNFLLNHEGKLQKHGFFTTRYVEANNPEEAELKAVDLIKTDSKLTESVKNDRADEPMIYLEELFEIESFEGENIPGTGYSFFLEDEPEK
jgi:hypothetical protein